MYIIFSPAKDMDLSKSSKKAWKPTEKTQEIIKEILNYSNQDLKKKFKLSDAKLSEVKSYIKGFEDKVTYHAISLYKGLSYKSLDVASLEEEDLDFLQDHLLIFSALYGPIKPKTPIKPYRLDFLSGVKVDGKSLKSYWDQDFSKALKSKSLVFNLASEEFSSLVDKDDYDWIDFEFYQEDKNGNLKSHSTYSKKGRGFMLRLIAQTKPKTVKDLEISSEHLTFRADLSDDKKKVYILR